MMKKATLVIPAYNEERTIKKVINAAKRVRCVNEIIVVDDGSMDRTYETAKREEAKVIRHRKNRGKGAGIKTGIKNSRNKVICFVDADIVNISPKKISKLILPVLRGEADFVKSSFKRAAGRVTELVAKPLLKIFYPWHNFNQPLSGQFCAKRSFLQTLEIPDRWGVDLSLFLDALDKNQKVIEVDIGRIHHKHQPLANLIGMAEEVMHTVFKKAGLFEKYVVSDKDKLISSADSVLKGFGGANKKSKKSGLVVFDLDRTLIDLSSIEFFAKRFGFWSSLKNLRKKLRREEIKEYEITLGLSKFFKGARIKNIRKHCGAIPLKKNVARLINSLRVRGYDVAVISSAFSPIAEFFAEKFSVKNVICPKLKVKNGVCTGEVDFSGIADLNGSCCSQSVCKKKALRILAEKNQTLTAKCVAVGDGSNDSCMLQEAGLGIAVRGNKKAERAADVIIDNLTEVLLYV